MSDKRTSLAAIEKVLEDMPRTGVPDGISLADNRVDRSGFDGLIDLPVYEHDTIVPTWGYAPIPSASAFTLISREGGPIGIVEVIVDDEPKRPPSGSRRSGSSKNVGAGASPPPYERLGLVNEFGDGNMILRAPFPEAEP